jgi:rhamnosyltransferase
MQHCNDADYFSFCDQDDYWYENKLSRAVSLLEKENNQKPCVYLCDFFWCNSNMERERQNKGYQKYHSLEKYVTLGDRNAFGFTEVFNRNALESVMDNNSFEGCSHDEIIYMYCLCNGNVIWDDMVCADYRRHGDNASKLDLVGGNKFTHFLWRIKTFLLKSSKEQSYERMAVFYDNFKDDLNRESRNVFELYLGNKKRVKKTFMVKRYRDSIVDEICIRILFLLGRV